MDRGPFAPRNALKDPTMENDMEHGSACLHNAGNLTHESSINGNVMESGRERLPQDLNCDRAAR